MFKEIFKNTWVFEGEGSRVFLLAGTEKALMIDTGMNGPEIVTFAREMTALPLELINSHADGDHIGGNAAFSRMYMHPSEACVYHSLNHGTGELVPVYDGTLLDLGGRSLKILHVPGHTPGSITVLDRKSRCLFGGDPIQKNGEIYMFGPHRDMDAYILGLYHLLESSEEFDLIYPSHAEMPVSKSLIEELIRGAKAILAGELQGTEREVFGTKILVYDIGVTRFLCNGKA